MIAQVVDCVAPLGYDNIYFVIPRSVRLNTDNLGNVWD